MPGCPEYFSKQSTSREAPDDKRLRLEMQNLEDAIQQSIECKSSYDEERLCKSFDDFQSKINLISIPKGWTVTSDSTRVMFLSIEFNPAPVIHKCIIVDSSMQLTVYYRNVVLSKVKQFIFPFLLQNVNDATEILQEVEFLNQNVETNSCKSAFNVISDSVALLKTLLPSANENLDFILSQLSLIIQGKHNYKYDTDFLIFCSLLFSISPHAYKFLRNSHHIILPHPYTIYRICSFFHLNPAIEQSEDNFLSYIKQRFRTLQSQDLTVCLMMDEIHIKPGMDYKGGNVVGHAYDNEKCATSAYVFMVQSFLSTYKDVAHILPVKKINAEGLFRVIKKVIIGLENIGFKVICVSSDNNAINGKAMSNFNDPPMQSFKYKHPSDENRPLFFIYDPVHILKCVRNNWLNQKNAGQCMFYPDFENSNITKTACFSTVKKLHAMEAGKLLKFGYGVTLKAVEPTNVDRQNVKFVLKVFNDHVIEGLRECDKKEDLQHVQDTADYIRLIYTWWSIMNVKTLFKGQSKRDIYQEPLTLSETDERYIFLNKFLIWLENWKNLKYTTGILTRETYGALKHTTQGVLELLSYCVKELGFSYLLTGKIQTDALERRFGKFRQLAGSQYLISMRQVFETESKLRLQSIGPLKIKSSKYGELSVDVENNEIVDLGEASQEYDIPIFAQNITISDDDISTISDILPVISYVAGYCAFATIKKLRNCAFCKLNLIMETGDESYPNCNSFIEKMDRGGLRYPHPKVLDIIIHTYLIVQKLVSTNYEQFFLKVSNQRQLVVTLANSVLCDKEIFISGDCPSGHSVTVITRYIIMAATNTFLKNYCKEKNDVRNSENKKRKLATIKN